MAWLTHAGIAPPVSADKTTSAPGSSASPRPSRLAHIRSWAYQLQKLDIDTAARAPVDLLVIDHDALSYGPKGWARRALKKLQSGPGRQDKRIVLSYLSIGEAENYRNYWRDEWVETDPATGLVPDGAGNAGLPASQAPPPAAAAPAGSANPPRRSRLAQFSPRGFWHPARSSRDAVRKPTSLAPDWLGSENPDWRGNFHVRFWLPSWKRTIFGSAQSALDRIIALGFDGVYLDRADAFEVWRHRRPAADRDMIGFIKELAAYARAKNPDFVIVLQNAEELTRDRSLRNTIDAIAKEDLIFGLDDSGEANHRGDIETALGDLKRVQEAGRPVLVVEYISDPQLRQKTVKRLTALGFIGFFAHRELDDLQVKF